MIYTRIQPFPAPGTYTFPELRALVSVWQEKKAALEGYDAYKEFLRRLQREWAIETGIIERLYTWDRGVTEILISQGIESSIISHQGGISQDDAEHIQKIIGDHLEIIEGLFGYIKGEEPLSEYFIRGLQEKFTAHQNYVEALTETGMIVRIPALRGDYKTSPNNPRRPDGDVHVYCPPEIVKEEMENLVRIYREAEHSYPPEVKAAWLHHRFTQIHPFQDGNGRVARGLASLVFIREGLFPLVVRDSDRKEYIGALETADAGDMGDLVRFFVRRQKDALLKALGLEQQIQQSRDAEQIVDSALEILKSKSSEQKVMVSPVYEHANTLLAMTEEKFQKLAKTLDPKLRRVTPPERKLFHVRTDFADNLSPQRHYFQKQIMETAKIFDYFANLEKYRAWARITLTTEQEFDYVVSFHGYGYADTGILVASAFTYLKTPCEDGHREPICLRPAAVDFFQFNYAEDYHSIEKRFAEWLEDSTVIALGEWKRALLA
jgi:Fic family protein